MWSGASTNIPSRRISCDCLALYPRASFGRHRPLRHSAKEVSHIRTSSKLRQNAAMDLPQYDAPLTWRICRLFVAFNWRHFTSTSLTPSLAKASTSANQDVLWLRNIRAIARPTGRGLVPSATDVQTTDSPRPHPDRVRNQAVNMFSPRPQPRPQSFLSATVSRAANVRVHPQSSNYPCPASIRAGFTPGTA
jgi:hypothetical protein